MKNFNSNRDHESHEQPLNDRYMDFVIDHIKDYKEPRELGEAVSSSYTIDTAWQVVPIRDLAFRVENNDDLEMENIHQRYYTIEMYMDNGADAKVPIKLTMVDGERIPGNYNFYITVDDELEFPAKDSLVEHMMATIDDFDIPNNS